MQNTEVAQYIAKILGGAGAIRCMTGGTVHPSTSGGLLLAGLKNAKFNYVSVDLNEGTDLFDVRFQKTRKYSVVKEEFIEGIYIDQLKSLVESKTGLYLTLN